jgi:hypothetical protein
MSGEDGRRLERSIRRIETLVAALEDLSDPAARESARELFALLLDLHGLALARMMAIVAAASEGRVLLGRLIEDDQVRVVLLLHGLHPEEAETRVRKAVEALQPGLRGRGVRLEVIEAGAERVRLRVRLPGGAAAGLLAKKIEEAIIEAAPDLEEIVIEGLEEERDEAPTGELAAAD